MATAIGYGPDGRIVSEAASELPEDSYYKLLDKGGDKFSSVRRDAREYPGLGVIMRETFKTRNANNPAITSSMVFVPGASLRKAEDGSRWELVANVKASTITKP
jgi:hypothetical protein